MVDETTRNTNTLIESDNTYEKMDCGLYFRSSHEVYGAIAELEGVTSELEKKLEIDMSIFKRNLRQNEYCSIESVLIDIQNHAAESAAKHIQMASAAHKALISLRLYNMRNQEVQHEDN